MKLTSRVEVRYDAPMHVYTPLTHALYQHSADPHLGDTSDIYAEDNPPIFEVGFEDLAVRIELKLGFVDNPLVKSHQTYACNRVVFELTRSVEDMSEFESARKLERPVHLRALHTMSKRLVAFFRYDLWNPFLGQLNAGHIDSWEWFDEHGKSLGVEPRGMVLARFPGQPGTSSSLGSSALRRAQAQELMATLEAEIRPSVAYELRAQAQEAIFAGKGFLAVLLLAVTAEVAIKTAFFRGSSIASDAFDYLEEKQQIEISPVELIDKVAGRAFGESFRDHSPGAFVSIEYLFRCRNKIAHRANAMFRDKDGKLRTPNATMLVDWWSAVSTLLCWLESKCGRSVTSSDSEKDYGFALDAWKDHS